MIFNYEGFMIILQAFCFLTFMTDFATFLTFFLSMALFTIQYLIISVVSTKIQDAYNDIGTALYCSKWYWMSVDDRKTMLQIMSVAVRSKTLCVGIFGESSLDRFTSVSNFLIAKYQF